MAELGKKRKASGSLEDVTKRIRIVTTSKMEDKRFHYEVPEESEHSQYSNDEDSEDNESHTADTPITPFSPSQKYPSELKTIKCTWEGCSKIFNRPARLTSHLRSHTNERPFACNYAGCDKNYMEEKHLKQHIKGSHTHEKSYQCDWDRCSKSFLTATRLRRHREAHEGHDRFRCSAYPPCNQSFRKHQTLQRHIRAEHLQLASFPCTHFDSNTQVKCNTGFDSAGALRKHEDRVHGALRFWCDECSSSGVSGGSSIPQPVGFRVKNELTKHIRTEHSNCIFCDLKFNNQNELQKHIETHHSTSSTTERRDNIAERKIVACSYPGCLRAFTKKYNLSVHIRTSHKGERFICSASSTTSYTFKTPDLAIWNAHNACGKDFMSKLNLEDHIRTQHLGLPSIVNAKRTKDQGHSSTRKTAGHRSPRADEKNDDLNAINLLTGAGYSKDPARNLSCLVADCPWLFSRKYDLEQHLRSKHDLSASEVEEATQSVSLFGFYPGVKARDCESPHDRGTLDQMYEQADLEWEIQRTRAGQAEDEGECQGEVTPLWIGAGEWDEEGRDGNGDIWPREEEEMRRLIYQDALIDPSLADA